MYCIVTAFQTDCGVIEILNGRKLISCVCVYVCVCAMQEVKEEATWACMEVSNMSQTGMYSKEKVHSSGQHACAKIAPCA